VRLSPGAIAEFLPAAQAMIAASRAEPGCLEYAYSRDLLEPDTLRIVERFKDEAALSVHFQTPHMEAFQQKLAALPMQAASVQIYAGAHKRAMIER
jgi:quinol monooxygenase YgiN